MNKKRIAISLMSIMLIMVGIGVVYKNNMSTSIPINASIWKKVKIKNEVYIANGSISPFDLEKIITESDYVFSGTVINREEYEVDWTDENGEYWGPFPSSLIEVKVNKEYYGKSPVEGDVIKVYYPYSFSMAFNNSFLIEDNSEYVFITRALDEDFVKQKEINNPDDRFEQEKYADVYISDTYSNLMAIEDDIVFMCNEFFSDNKAVMSKVLSDELNCDKIISSQSIENEWLIALDKADFNKAFLDLFNNQDELTLTNNYSKVQEGEIE